MAHYNDMGEYFSDKALDDQQAVMQQILIDQQRWEEDKLKGPAKVIVFEDKEVKAIIIENAD